jgi:hypothetical protein
MITSIIFIIFVSWWIFYVFDIFKFNTGNENFVYPIKDIVFDGSDYLTIPVNWIASDFHFLFGLKFKTSKKNCMLFLNKIYDSNFYALYLDDGQLCFSKGPQLKNKVFISKENLADGFFHNVSVTYKFLKLYVDIDGQQNEVVPPTFDPIRNNNFIYIGGGPTVDIGKFYNENLTFEGCISFIQTPLEFFTFENFTLTQGFQFKPC